MSDIIEQLGLDSTIFVQLAIFIALLLILTPLYFRPFQNLFEKRHQRTKADQEAAEKLMAQAEAKLNEYKTRLSDERTVVRKEYEEALAQARKDEGALLSQAREQAKKITQEVSETVARQQEALRKQLAGYVETLAQTISEKLLSGKGAEKP